MQKKKQLTSNYVDVDNLKKAVSVLRALNHPMRQQMMELIDQNISLDVTTIYVKMKLEQSVASSHLAILRKADIVLTERNGKHIFYQLNKTRIEEISNLVDTFVSE